MTNRASIGVTEPSLLTSNGLSALYQSFVGTWIVNESGEVMRLTYNDVFDGMPTWGPIDQ